MRFARHIPLWTGRAERLVHNPLLPGILQNCRIRVSKGVPGEPARVVACWTEGVQKMKVGGKSKFIYPSSIAYGDQGRPPQIPGGAVLVFEIELLGIETSAKK